MKKDGYSGMTLVEVLVAMIVVSIVMSITLGIFAASNHYYEAGSSRVDAQSSAELALNRLVRETQESDPSGISTLTPGTIVLVSAREANGNQFAIYNGIPSGSSTPPYCGSSPASDTGKPCWQKWICYYLAPQSGSSYQELIRVEGNPTGSSFPSTAIPLPIPSASAFQGVGLPQTVMARNIKTFNVQSSCGLPGMDYIQLVAAENNNGLTVTYNPGVLVGSGNCMTGNWIEALPRN